MHTNKQTDRDEQKGRKDFLINLKFKIKKSKI